eukprot:m.17475 g.17475  ORF g.17475 m.17475 type:complete len:378 (-) comp3503_c0_seq1:3288-4421(-)
MVLLHYFETYSQSSSVWSDKMESRASQTALRRLLSAVAMATSMAELGPPPTRVCCTFFNREIPPPMGPSDAKRAVRGSTLPDLPGLPPVESVLRSMRPLFLIMCASGDDGRSDESFFAKSIVRLPPLLSNRGMGGGAGGAATRLAADGVGGGLKGDLNGDAGGGRSLNWDRVSSRGGGGGGRSSMSKGGGRSPAVSEHPHSPQNLAVGAMAALHATHVLLSVTDAVRVSFSSWPSGRAGRGGSSMSVSSSEPSTDKGECADARAALTTDRGGRRGIVNAAIFSWSAGRRACTTGWTGAGTGADSVSVSVRVWAGGVVAKGVGRGAGVAATTLESTDAIAVEAVSTCLGFFGSTRGGVGRAAVGSTVAVGLGGASVDT